MDQWRQDHSPALSVHLAASVELWSFPQTEQVIAIQKDLDVLPQILVHYRRQTLKITSVFCSRLVPKWTREYDQSHACSTAQRPLWRQMCLPKRLTGPWQRYLAPESIGMSASAGSQVFSDQPQTRNFRNILIEVDVLACLLLGAFLSQTVGYGFVMPKLRRVLRTVLPGAIEDSRVCCLTLSGRGPALVTGWGRCFSCVSPRNHVKTTQRRKTLQLIENFPHRNAHDTSCVHADIQSFRNDSSSSLGGSVETSTGSGCLSRDVGSS